MGPPLPSKSIAHAEVRKTRMRRSFWIDYACPFSAKMFKRMHEEVMPHYKGKNKDLSFITRYNLGMVHIMHETAI